jgi:hypothetical protein
MNTENDLMNIEPGTIAVVGEYTTNTGPFFDDYFLVVVFHSGKFIEVPTDKANDVIDRLEKAIGEKIVFGLANITDFASRVIYPSQLKGRPLFDFSFPPSDFRSRLKRIMSLNDGYVTGQLTEEVKNYISKK